ncbi:MAG: hypothetical protein QF404_01480 [Planctomycetota bacterium]|jgi:hypothetical protein|nr:hypothetical protein [Planctomycetota bacterium]MDP6939153.1 hypothetical protein [Planctomycetota bacterium]
MLHALATVMTPVCLAALMQPGVKDSIAFGVGRQTAAEKDAVLLVLAHGSDWNILGERMFHELWNDSDFASAVGCVLADVDVLQSPSAESKQANDARNKGWVEKGSGLRTYPAILAYAPDGTLIGSRQGADLPRKVVEIRAVTLQFAADCRKWVELTAATAKAKAGADPTTELTLLIQRDGLPLARHPSLLEDLRRLDPDDAGGHLARLSLPHWNTLVQQATSQAQAGKGEEAEQRLLGLLANTAYTREQRAGLHLALGSVYRRWADHDELAAKHMRTASTVAPDSVCGIAGMRLYLRLYGGPSLFMGWDDRHTTDTAAANWVIEDLPAELEAGVYTLRLKCTRGGSLMLTGAALCVDGKPIVLGPGEAELAGKGNTLELEFTLDKPLSNATLQIILGERAKSRGELTWTRLR